MKINKEEVIKRILYMRKDILGVTGKKLSEMSGTDWSAIKKWEIGMTSFTTKTTIFKIAKCFNAAGIYVTEEWIQFGTGPKPKKYTELKKIDFNLEEEDLFRSRITSMGHKCAIISIAGEDAMHPVVERGDRIGGAVYFEDFKKYVGQCCIVGYNDGKEIFRKLQLKPKSSAGFELVALNKSKAIVPEKIEWVAPLVRRWRY